MTLRLSLRAWVVLITLGLGIGFSFLVWQQLSTSGSGLLFNDFRILYGAAQALAHGRNPYNRATLLTFERTAPGFSSWAGKSEPYPEPPVVAVMLWPLTGVPLVAAYGIYTAVSVTAMVAAVVAFARALRWRHVFLLTIGVLTAGIAAFGFAAGQLDALLLAATLAALVLAWRGSYLAAGLALGAFWLKPDILWPAALFLAIGLWPDRRAVLRYVIGFVIGTTALVILNLRLFPVWLASLLRFQRSRELVGLPGVIVERLWPTAHPSSAIFVVIVAVAVVLLAALGRWILSSPRWRELDQQDRLLWAVGLSLAIWLTLTPYSHSNDTLLVLPLVVAMLGRDAAWAGKPAVALAVLALAVPVGNFSSQLWPMDVNPAPLPCALALIAGLWTLNHRVDSEHYAPLAGPLAEVRGVS
ncbi:MAG: hypothetical protein WA809_00525 [Candidatus Dormiibacterota bacterium]